jgi:lysyl-tRNA synthetase class 2
MIDIDKVQKALDRAAASKNRAGRFRLKANMPDVGSSMMNRIDYEESTKELDITFTSGKTYRYLDVPPEIYGALVDADSKGQFFNEYIKNEFAYCAVQGRLR